MMNEDILSVIVRFIPEMSISLEMSSRGLKKIVTRCSLRGYAAIRAGDYVGMKLSRYKDIGDVFNVAARCGRYNFARKVFSFIPPTGEREITYSVIRYGLIDIAKKMNPSTFLGGDSVKALKKLTEAAVRNGTWRVKDFMSKMFHRTQNHFVSASASNSKEEYAELAVVIGSGKELYIDPLDEHWTVKWHIYRKTEESNQFVRDYLTNWRGWGHPPSHLYHAMCAGNYELAKFCSEREGGMYSKFDQYAHYGLIRGCRKLIEEVTETMPFDTIFASLPDSATPQLATFIAERYPDMLSRMAHRWLKTRDPEVLGIILTALPEKDVKVQFAACLELTEVDWPAWISVFLKHLRGDVDDYIRIAEHNNMIEVAELLRVNEKLEEFGWCCATATPIPAQHGLSVCRKKRR